MSDMILLEKQGSIAILTLNRPEAMNALGEAGDGALVAAACAQIEDDPTIRAAILTGAGRAFSAAIRMSAMQA
ncbi:MAG: enoyl-CoA hydratase-related protein, partial [Pseudomonadota bacterium]